MCGNYVFFSSRRRHTRYWRDWSSDVCSSDLASESLIGGRITSRRAPSPKRTNGSPPVRCPDSAPEVPIRPSLLLCWVPEQRVCTRLGPNLPAARKGSPQRQTLEPRDRKSVV